LNPDGRLIFWTIDAFDHIEPFVLNDEYGVVLYNEGSQEQPEPRYILACQNNRSILLTADFEQFRRELQKIPIGTRIGRYDTCSVPRAYGLPDDLITRFQAALSEAGLKVESEGRHVCYCPKHG